MRAMAYTLVLGVVIAAAGGCGRQPDIATPKSSPSRVVPTAMDQPSQVETDPAKLLFRALVFRDVGEVTKILDAHPELVNKQVNKTYPLWVASESQSLALVRAVVERGADLKVRSKDNQTILWAAVTADDLDTVKYLVGKGADVKALQDDKQSLLWAAPSKAMAEYLLAAGIDPKMKDANGDTALHQACRHSHADVVEVLLDRGLDIEAKGHWNMPPLHAAASTLTGEPRAVVNLLLQRGANINARGFEGHTVIHECAFYNRLPMAEMLLSRGAEPDLKDDKGRTPLDIAYIAGKADRVRMINLLIKHGAGEGRPDGILLPVPKDE